MIVTEDEEILTEEKAEFGEVASEIPKVTITDEAHFSNKYFFTQDDEIEDLGKSATNNRYDRKQHNTQFYFCSIGFSVTNCCGDHSHIWSEIGKWAQGGIIWKVSQYSH